MTKKILVANYIAGGWSALMGILFVPIYVRYLGIEAYGLVGIFASMQVWFALLDMGMAPSLGREMARFKAGARTPRSIVDLFHSLEIVYLVVAVSMALLTALGSAWLAVNWLNGASIRPATIRHALVLIGLVVSLRWLGALYRSALIGLQKQVLLSGFNLVFSTLRGAGVVLVLIYVAPSVQAFFVYQGCVGAIETVILAGIMRNVLPTAGVAWRFCFAEVKEVLNFAGGMALITVLSILLTQTDKLMLSKMLPLAEFGYYSLATTAAGALYLLVTPVANAAYPRLTGLVIAGDSTALAGAYHSFSQVLTLTLIPATVVMAVFSSHLLLLWTRDATTSAAVAPLFSAILIGNMLNGLMHTPYNLQLAHGWTSLTVVVNAISLVLLLPLIYFGVKHFGAIAAAFSWVALNLGYLLIALPLMHGRILKTEKWKWYLRDVLWPLVAVSVCTVGVRLLTPNPDIRDPGGIIRTLIMAAAVAMAAASLTVPVVKVQFNKWRSVRV